MRKSDTDQSNKLWKRAENRMLLDNYGRRYVAKTEYDDWGLNIEDMKIFSLSLPSLHGLFFSSIFSFTSPLFPLLIVLFSLHFLLIFPSILYFILSLHFLPIFPSILYFILFNPLFAFLSFSFSSILRDLKRQFLWLRYLFGVPYAW